MDPRRERKESHRHCRELRQAMHLASVEASRRLRLGQIGPPDTAAARASSSIYASVSSLSELESELSARRDEISDFLKPRRCLYSGKGKKAFR